MKWMCIGAGSVGLLFAGKLAASGADMTMVTRTKEQAEALTVNGIAINGTGQTRHTRVKALDFDAMEYSQPKRDGFNPDLILLTVKQRHLTDSFLASLSGLLGERGRLICFQNGIGHVERIVRHICPSRVYLAVTTEGARRKSPWEVDHTGEGVTRVGRAVYEHPDLSDKSDFFEKMLVQALNGAGFRCFLSNQMSEVLWNKLLINAVINPLTALLGMRNGELPGTDYARGLMKRILEEGIAAARASGTSVSADLWEQILDVCAMTAENRSSMLQDLSAGRVTEIDWINGAIVRTAASCGLDAPVNETVYRLVKALECGSENGENDFGRQRSAIKRE